MSSSTPLLTIFTPAYNRANTLPRLHDSLLAQAVGGFEWLVVDDGSTDGTGDLVRGWAAGSPFPVRYLWQENSGKHAAHNLGAKKARGRFFICVDSDDWLEPNAVATIGRDSADLNLDEGLIYPKLFSDQATFAGVWFPGEAKAIELAEMGLKYGLKIETAIVFRTEVLRRHPFPLIEGERYISESSAYQDFHKPEVFRVHDDCFYRCEYQAGGLTRNIWVNWYRNPKGARLTMSKGYKEAKRFRTIYSLRCRIASIVGIESLNMALGVPWSEGLPEGCGVFERVICLPVSRWMESKRYGVIISDTPRQKEVRR